MVKDIINVSVESQLKSIVDGLETLNDSVVSLNNEIADIKAWKERKESVDAERLTRIHNEVVDVIVRNRLTIEETVSILEMTKQEAIVNFKASK